MKTLSNPLLNFDTYIDMKTAMEKKAYPIVLNGCVDSQKAHFIPNLGEDFPCRLVLTYKEDKDSVVSELQALIHAGVYPKKLF